MRDSPFQVATVLELPNAMTVSFALSNAAFSCTLNPSLLDETRFRRRCLKRRASVAMARNNVPPTTEIAITMSRVRAVS